MNKHLFCVIALVSSLGFSDEAAFEVSPIQEGMYAVKVECRDPEPADLCAQVAGDRPMIIMNSPGYAGIIISIANEEVQMPIYSFNYGSLRENGRLLEARTAFPQSVQAALRLEFRTVQGGAPSKENPQTVFGWIRDPRFPADLKVTGLQLYSAEPFFSMPTSKPITMGEVVGVYEGVTGEGTLLRLTVRPAINDPGKGYVASMQTSLGLEIKFPFVTLDAEKRLLQLLAPQSSKGTALKWLLKFEDVEDPSRLDGVALIGTGGRITPLALERKD